MNGIQIAIHAPLSDSPLGRGNCDKLPVSNATKGFLLFQFFQSKCLVASIWLIVLPLLAVGCSAPAPTVTPVPTPTPTVAPTPAPSTGNWVQFVDTDPITDEKETVITLVASESTLEFPYDDPLLFVQCRNLPRSGPVLWVSISWNAYIGSRSTVEWRVNSETASEELWRSFGDSFTSSHKPKQIVSDLGQADKITARVTGSVASYTAIWHPEGFAEAFKPVASACGQ